jgi:hypothetical protein
VMASGSDILYATAIMLRLFVGKSATLLPKTGQYQEGTMKIQCLPFFKYHLNTNTTKSYK